MKASAVAVSVLAGVAAMLIVVAVSLGLGLHHTWFPGGLLAFGLVGTRTLLILEGQR